MPPHATTTLHQHDDDDELLSGVYYVHAPKNSGSLIVHCQEKIVEIEPQTGKWVFFSPALAHEVRENLSNELRLSVAFNFA